MESHETWEKRSSTYFDGELEEAEQVLFSAHLKNCRLCEEDLASFRNTRQVFRNFTGIPVSKEIKHNLFESAKAAEDPFTFRQWLQESIPFYKTRFRFAVEFISLIAGITLGVLGFEFFEDEKPNQVQRNEVYSTSLFGPVFPGSLTESYLEMEFTRNEK